MKTKIPVAQVSSAMRLEPLAPNPRTLEGLQRPPPRRNDHNNHGELLIRDIPAELPARTRSLRR